VGFFFGHVRVRWVGKFGCEVGEVEVEVEVGNGDGRWEWMVVPLSLLEGKS
jgi:hypothetical protein